MIRKVTEESQASRVDVNWPASAEALDAATERELLAMRARRLVDEGGMSEIAYLVVAAVTGALVWKWVTAIEVVVAWLTVALAVGWRHSLRRRAAAEADPALALRLMRRGVVVVALAWAAGTLAIAPQLPPEQVAFLAVVAMGLVAAGSVSLIPDPHAFYYLATILLTAMAVAIGLEPQTQTRAFGILAITMYGIVMALFYRRSHAGLLTQLRTAKRLELVERAAAESRSRAEGLAQIVEATSDNVIIAGADTRIRYLNHASRAMLGVAPDEDVLGLTFFDFVPPAQAEEGRAAMGALLERGVWTGDQVLQRRDGSTFPMSVVAHTHRDANGQLDAISAIGRDMTAERESRAALAAALAAAERANSAKSVFLANTSHEIRTPLNGILGMVELLQDTDLSPEQRRSVDLIAASGETLLHTINDLLDLSKIEARQLELEKAPFDLHQLLYAVVRLFAARASTRDVEVVCDIGAGVPEFIVSDAHRLRQILSNLVGNAVKFTERGEVVLYASVPKGRPDALRISVRDSGIGIPESHLERIFLPFSQVDGSTTRNYGGTGLGLPIARQLVGLLDGTLAVESTLGEGTEFSFTIPVQAPGDREYPAIISTASLSKVRVLVVDDHAINRRIFREHLASVGADALCVSDATSALGELLQAAHAKTPFAVLVTDVQMPARDGFSLVELVRGDPRLAATPVVMLTSGARSGDAARARALGVSAYVEKPVMRRELVTLIGKALGAESSRADEARSSFEHTVTPRRVLIAEDNPINQEVAASMLRKRGHHVEIAADGCEAVDAIREHGDFDVILMDMQMPNLDGIGATKRIREELHATLPIMALTANVQPQQRQQCLDAGMNGFLSKPFKAHELFAIVERSGPAADQARRETPGDPTPATPVDLISFRQMLADADIAESGNAVLRIFLDDSPSRVQALARACASGVAADLASAAHALKSSAGNIQARALANLLADAEHLARSGEMARAIAAVRDIEAEYQRVDAYLRQRLPAAA